MKFGKSIIVAISCLVMADSFVQPSAFGAKKSVTTALDVATTLDVTKDNLLGAQKMIDDIIYEKACGPILVRLAWHDSGTFDVNIKEEWPAAGGAIASIRLDPEITHGANNGLINAIKLLEPVKEAFPDVSYADIFQMASARSIETAGGPKIGVKYGRVDSTGKEQCSPEGNLPDGEAGEDGNYGGTGGTASTEDTKPEGHLRKVFYRMGLNDEQIVALSGAHTFGKMFQV
jgi:L-ascorbate peroxidase